jgi:hypothetical protein
VAKIRGTDRKVGRARIILERSLRGPRRRCVCNIKMELGETGWGGMDWSYLPQDSDQWRALVNMVMNFQIKKNIGKFLVAAQLAASQEGLSSMKVG